MSNFRVILSRVSAKKVPALALVVVGLAGMVVGVLAATLTVTTNNYTGEIGSLHANTGAFTVTDNGLQVLMNTLGNNATTMQVPATGSNTDYRTATVAGDWAERLTFTTSLNSAGNIAHTVTVTIRNGSTTSAVGNALTTYSGTIKEPTASSSGTVNLYIDLTAATLNAPVAIYVSVV